MMKLEPMKMLEITANTKPVKLLELISNKDDDDCERRRLLN
jgi:hypothetical protein